MSICMRCGGKCTCNRHGKVPEELFYICAGKLKYPADHKGKCLEHIRKVLDEHVAYKITRSNKNTDDSHRDTWIAAVHSTDKIFKETVRKGMKDLTPESFYKWMGEFVS